VTTARVVHQVDELADLVAVWKAAGETIALVPTMGALHEGHLALVRRAQAECSRVVVSIFVNPLQFLAGEDFDRYPRTLDSDMEALKLFEVDAVFAPEVTDVYPNWPDIQPTVFAGPVGDMFEGQDRPGHFDGVLTVVSRLFELVSCDRAVFGQKDAQQVFLVSQLAATTTPPVHISVVDTVRDKDGVARSSRNFYLSDSNRRSATALHRALVQVSESLREVSGGVGKKDVEAILSDARATLSGEGRTLHYIDVVDRDTFTPFRGGQATGLLVIVACSVGGVRLIDAVRLDLHADSSAAGA